MSISVSTAARRTIAFANRRRRVYVTLAATGMGRTWQTTRRSSSAFFPHCRSRVSTSPKSCATPADRRPLDLRAAGFAPVAGRAIRFDMLERLEDELEKALASGMDADALLVRIVSLLGSSKDEGRAVLEALDWRTVPVEGALPDAKADRREGKIILVSQHYAPFPSSTSAYMTQIAEELSCDSRVIVITSAPGSASKLPLSEGKPEVIEIKSWWPGKSALVSRTFAAVLFSVQVFLAVLKHARSDDVLLSVTTPFTLPYTVTLAARLRKAASALIIYDFYPDSLVMAGFLRANSLLTRVLRLANRMMFRLLDAIVIIGRLSDAYEGLVDFTSHVMERFLGALNAPKL